LGKEEFGNLEDWQHLGVIRPHGQHVLCPLFRIWALRSNQSFQKRFQQLLTVGSWSRCIQ
jgi:hypothetical protein